MPAPVSVAQKKEILSLLKQSVDSPEIAARVGVTPGQVGAIKAHVSMGTYGDDGGNDVEADLATALNTTFGLEHDMQLALRRSIEQLEPGLTIIDGDREQTVASGRIDITARDMNGSTVVIELKAGPADRDAVGRHCQIKLARPNGDKTGSERHAATVASCHWIAASALEIRSVDRETRWR
jgi:hypothetical protein